MGRAVLPEQTRSDDDSVEARVPARRLAPGSGNTNSNQCAAIRGNSTESRPVRNETVFRYDDIEVLERSARRRRGADHDQQHLEPLLGPDRVRDVRGEDMNDCSRRRLGRSVDEKADSRSAVKQLAKKIGIDKG